MSAANFDIYIEEGADFYQLLTFRDANGNLIDLTGYTFNAKIKKNVSDQNPVATFSFSILDQISSKGQVEWKLSSTEILNINLDKQDYPKRTKEQFCYDLYMTDTAPFTDRIMEGIAFVSPGVST
jgi:hypothetical protein